VGGRGDSERPIVIFAIATIALALLTAILLRPERPSVTYDRQADALYVVRRGTEIVDTMPAEHDGWLLVNRDDADDVVGCNCSPPVRCRAGSGPSIPTARISRPICSRRSIDGSAPRTCVRPRAWASA
jgi:uncharacterized protein YuzE